MRNTKAQLRIGNLLDEAESEGRCAYATTGADAGMLKRMEAEGRLFSPMRGMYVRCRRWESLNEGEREDYRARCLMRRDPRAVLTDFSAARAYGLSVSRRLLLDTTYTLRKRDDEPEGFKVVKGMRVVPVREMVARCLRAAPFCDGLAIADSALRVLRLSKDELEELVQEGCKGRRGAAKARRIAALADARAENGGESIVRAMMIEAGYMVPELQVVIPDQVDLRNSYRVDFYWALPDGRVLIAEMDGMVKYQSPEILGDKSVVDVLVDERQRESRLTLNGYPVARILFKRVFEEGYLESVLDALGVPKVA